MKQINSIATSVSDFLTEAPLAWSELRHFYSASKGTVRESSIPQAGAPLHSLPWTMLFRFNSNAGNERFEMESEKSGVLTVILANPDYGAVLSRENSDRPFVVEYLEWDPHSALEQAEAYRIQASGLKVDLESADAIVADPSFKGRLNVQAQKDSGEELVVVKFQCDVKHRPDLNVKSGLLCVQSTTEMGRCVI